MFKTINILFTCMLIWFASSSFMHDHLTELPAKKISKSIEKIWNIDDYQLEEMSHNSCVDNGVFFKVISGEKELGFIYSGRVNSCKSGGCAAETDEVNLAFEFFDYFMLLDTSKQVIWVKIYNYHATHGHEVMSRGWLNQFKGLEPGKSIIFGKDIEAISGATVSASAITEDIQQVLVCM